MVDHDESDTHDHKEEDRSLVLAEQQQEEEDSFDDDERAEVHAAATIASTNRQAAVATTNHHPKRDDAGMDREWRKQFELLEQFAQVTGHTKVPNDGSALYRWVQQQHCDYTVFVDQLEGRHHWYWYDKKRTSTTTTFTVEKLALLRNLGFVFERQYHNGGARARTRRTKYLANLALLKEFRAQFGHVQVPQNLASFNAEDAAKYHGLGQWLSFIRSALRQARIDNPEHPEAALDPNFLPPDFVQRLDDVGVTAELVRKRLPTTTTTTTTTAGPEPIATDATVVAPPAKRRRHSSSQASPQRTTAATTKPSTAPTTQQSKPQPASTKKTERWEARFEEMKQFIQEHGHSIVPSHPSTNNGPIKTLRTWLDKQRKEYKKLQAGQESTLLTTHRLQRLYDIGFEFQPKPRREFEQRFQQWLDYRAQHNGKDPPAFSPDGLGQWVSWIRHKKVAQEQDGKPNNLTTEQMNRLTAHGFAWKSNDKKRPTQLTRVKWEQRFQELQEFQRDHGHTSVPQSMPGLGSWVHKQRVKYWELQRGKRGNNQSDLTPHKIELLNSIGFEWISRQRQKQQQSLNASAAATTEQSMRNTKRLPLGQKEVGSSGDNDSEDEDDEVEEEESVDEHELRSYPGQGPAVRPSPSLARTLARYEQPHRFLPVYHSVPNANPNHRGNGTP